MLTFARFTYFQPFYFLSAVLLTFARFTYFRPLYLLSPVLPTFDRLTYFRPFHLLSSVLLTFARFNYFRRFYLLSPVFPTFVRFIYFRLFYLLSPVLHTYNRFMGRLQRTSGKWGGVVLKFRTFPDGGRWVVCERSGVRKFLRAIIKLIYKYLIKLLWIDITILCLHFYSPNVIVFSILNLIKTGIGQ